MLLVFTGGGERRGVYLENNIQNGVQMENKKGREVVVYRLNTTLFNNPAEMCSSSSSRCSKFETYLIKFLCFVDSGWWGLGVGVYHI